jgi:hypothetical protein
MPVTVFFSYSHLDECLRNELEKHLSVLKRSGIIATWHDRRIGAGKEFDPNISYYLESADIILLLISANFLASDYCYDIEMRRAVERHNAGEAHVIPVILHACDWQYAPFGKLLAVPTDGRPVTQWPDPNEAFLNIVQALRQAASELSGESGNVQAGFTEPGDMNISSPSSTSTAILDPPRSSNLRIQKTFTDEQRNRFRKEAFDYIARYFEASLAELETRNPEITTDFERVDATRFMCVAYIAGRAVSEMTVWRGSPRGLGGEISYYLGRTTGSSSTNGGLTVRDDGHMLYLQSLFGGYHQDEKSQLSSEGAAALFWDTFMEPMQR